MSTVLHSLAVEISGNSTKFAQATKDAQKNVHSFSGSLKEFGNQTTIAGQNLGGLASQFTSFLNPATAAAGVISGLGAAYLNTHAGAEALEEVQFRLEASFELLGRETGKLIDTLGELGGSDSGGGVLDGIKSVFTDLNPIVALWNYSIAVTDKLTGGYITRLKEEEEALAKLKGIYDDLLRDRVIESESVAELERQIENLKTQRVEENVSTKQKIELDKQILKLEEDRYLKLVFNAEARKQQLEAEATALGGINNLNDTQLQLLIDTRNEVKNLEAEYSLRIRKIRKELTGLLEDLGKTGSSFGFDRSKLKDTGNVNIPGEYFDDKAATQATSDKQLESIIKETEAILGLGAAYGSINFNLDEHNDKQAKAAAAAQQAASNFESLTFIGERFAESVASGQVKAVQALGNATLDIIDLYLKQAMAAAIAGALRTGGPLPVGLALAGVGIAAVRGLFNRAVGSTGGGGGGASVPTVQQIKPQSGTLRERGDEIKLGGHIEVNGDRLLVVIKNAQDKNSVRRG